MGLDGIVDQRYCARNVRALKNLFLPENIHDTIEKRMRQYGDFNVDSVADLSLPDFSAPYREARDYIDWLKKSAVVCRILVKNSAHPVGELVLT
jgi:hypothetical protein